MTFNLEFYTSCQSSMMLEERQGVKKVYSVSTFCGSYRKTCSYNKKRKRTRKIWDSQNREPCIVFLQNWNVTKEERTLCQTFYLILFYCYVESHWLGKGPLEKQFYHRGFFQVISIMKREEMENK